MVRRATVAGWWTGVALAWAMPMLCVPRAMAQSVSTTPSTVWGPVPANPPSPGDDVPQAVATLPLEFGTLDELGSLRSGANEAVPATRGVGDAGEEDEDDGAGAARGATAAAGSSDPGLPLVLRAEQVDGVGWQQGFRGGALGAAPGGPQARSAYSQSALQSERVTGQSFRLERYAAEYGGAGGTRAVETRAGGAQLHGSVQWLTQESALAATNPYSVATSYSDGVVSTRYVKPSGAMNQFAAAVGLPLRWRGMPKRWDKRVSFFGSLDAELRDDRLVSSPASAAFFALTPEQTALLGNRGVGTTATNAALNYLSTLTGTTARRATRVSGFARTDVRPSKRDGLTAEWLGNFVDAPAGVALGQASDAVVARGTGSLGDSHAGVDAGILRWSHTLGRRWTNELRGQVARDLEYESARPSLAQEPRIGPGGLAPQVSIGPEGFAYGTPSSLGRTAYPDERRVELTERMRLQTGRHAIAMGGDWSRVSDRIANIAAAEGAFLYDSGTTNGRDGGLVDWITDYTFNVNAYPNGGCPSINAAVHLFCFRSYTQGFSATETAFVTHDFAGYAQDTWRVRERLTVTAGFRYDYTLLPLPQQPNATLDSDLAAAGIAAATSRFPEDRNNFGPRFAAAWTPAFAKWKPGVTVLAGYGVFYGRVPGGTVRAALNDTAMTNSALHVRITPSTVTQCPQITATSQGFGYACAYTAVPPAAVSQTTSATVFAPHFRAPMVQRGSFAVQKQAGRLTVRAGFETAVAHQLPASTDVNIAASPGLVEYVLQGGDAYPGLHTGETFVVPLYAQRLISQYGPVTEVESNANAYYNAGTAEAEWRGPHGWSARGSYTFARAIDLGPQASATPSLDSQFDPFADGYDKGVSSLQFPQRFAGSLVGTTRVTRGQRRLRSAATGWRLAAIGSAGSGAPYSYTVFGGTRLSGGHETLNGSGGATYLPTVGRNTLRLPPRGRVDARLGREFAAGRGRLSVFAEAFNLLNERNIAGVETRAFVFGTAATIGNPGTAGAPQPLVFQDATSIANEGLNTPAFGTPNSSTAGSSRERRVQFGLRWQF